ncbi:MAG: hypothetical protein U1F98_01205 [Verrucomicrobiota bacterium]
MSETETMEKTRSPERRHGVSRVPLERWECDPPTAVPVRPRCQSLHPSTTPAGRSWDPWWRRALQSGHGFDPAWRIAVRPRAASFLGHLNRR